MSGNAQNIRLGTCNIYYGTAGSEQLMGLTIGGVEVEVTTDTQQIMADQYGDTIVKENIRGRNCVVRMNLAETTVDNMATIMPGATLVGSGSKKTIVSTAVGIDLLSQAQQLILRPVELDDTVTPANADKSEDFTVPQAATAGALNFAYSKDNERVFNTEFRAYPTSTGTLFEYGDPAAT